MAGARSRSDWPEENRRAANACGPSARAAPVRRIPFRRATPVLIRKSLIDQRRSSSYLSAKTRLGSSYLSPLRLCAVGFRPFEGGGRLITAFGADESLAGPERGQPLSPGDCGSPVMAVERSCLPSELKRGAIKALRDPWVILPAVERLGLLEELQAKRVLDHSVKPNAPLEGTHRKAHPQLGEEVGHCLSLSEQEKGSEVPAGWPRSQRRSNGRSDVTAVAETMGK